MKRSRSPSSSRGPGRRPVWASWPDERLLDLRFCDLGVQIEGTWVQERIEQLLADLAGRGLRFRPHFWISSEWFSPTDVPGVALPFYLLHPRLMLLERRQMFEVDGGSREGCLKILRHETGHAIQRAYGLQRRRRWQQLFGRSSKKYPDMYRPDPASRRFVQHLRLYYAQAHPDEDFAETFAVWLRPRHVWRRRYADWAAIEKLEYVDELMAEIAGKAPAVRRRKPVDPLDTLTTTLREHYAERRKDLPPSALDVFDADLRKVFAGRGASSREPAERGQSASRFLRRHRSRIRRLVRRWTGAYEFTLDDTMDEMIRRVRELDLRATGDEQELLADFAMMLAVDATHALYSKKHWVPL